MTETAPIPDVQPAASATATIPSLSTPSEGSTDTPAFAVPEQYAGKTWAQNVKSLEDVYSQFDNQQSLLGKKNIPGPDATDEEIKVFHDQLRPETADKYELVLPEGVEAEINQEEQNVYKQLFHDIGLTPKQANALFQGHIKLETEKAGKLAEGQPTPEEAETAKDAEFDKLVKEKLGDKADEAIKITMKHALEHSEETKAAIAALPPEQMAAVVDLVHALNGKIASTAEEGAPQSGDAGTTQSIDEKVKEANRLRMSPEIKDPFHPENVSMRTKLKELDATIQKALSK